VHASGVVLAMLTLQFLPSFSSFLPPGSFMFAQQLFFFFLSSGDHKKTSKDKTRGGIEHIKLEYAVP
jgi:hypothetical protein